MVIAGFLRAGYTGSLYYFKICSWDIGRKVFPELPKNEFPKSM